MLHSNDKPKKGNLYSPCGSFDILLWRNMLIEAACNVSQDLHVIAPFGFEVMRNPAYLKRELNNFYVYIGVQESTFLCSSHLVEQFRVHLTTILESRVPDFFSAIFQVISPTGKTLYHLYGKKTLHIKFRPCSKDLLMDYALYLIASVGGVNKGKIKAVLDFHRDPLSQRYLFQLCLIIDRIFTPRDLHLSQEQTSFLYEQIKFLYTAETQRLSRTSTSPSSEQQAILEKVILPYFDRLEREIQRPLYNTNKVTSISMLDFHGRNTLTTSVQEIIALEKVDYIIESYNLCSVLQDD